MKLGIFTKFYLVVILLILLTTATYTWFSITSDPKVSDMVIYANSTEGLQLSTDWESEEWGQTIDFSSLIEESSILKPITWSDSEAVFYAAEMGLDGRVSDISIELNDEENSNRADDNGYYIVGTIYATSEEAVSVELSPAVEIDGGESGAGTYLIGSPVWNEETIIHDNGGSGAEYAVRIGLRITKLDELGNATEEEYWYIYEPNADAHVDGSLGYIATPSIDGTENLTTEEQLIVQSSSTWTEADPIEKDVTIQSLGEFTTDTQLFALEAGEYAQIDIYVWLEGQDVDCTNIIGSEAQIFANIQFYADTVGLSGLSEIE